MLVLLPGVWPEQPAQICWAAQALFQSPLQGLRAKPTFRQVTVIPVEIAFLLWG